MRRIRAPARWRDGERGQVLVMVAGGMVTILGLVALSTDVGGYLLQVRDAQNDVDSAALAGSAELARSLSAGASVSEAEATAVATTEEWAQRNGAGGELVWDSACGEDGEGAFIPASVSDSNGDQTPDTVCVGLERSSPTFFARIVGIDSLPLRRYAAARSVHAAGGAVCPWTLESTDPSDTDPSDGTYLGVEIGKIYAVKVGAGESGWGNFGVLKLWEASTGSYQEALQSGCETNPENVVVEGEMVETETEPGNIGENTIKCLGNPVSPEQPCSDHGPGYFVYELTDGIHDDQDFGWCDVPMIWDPVSETGDPTEYDPLNDGPRQGCGSDAANGGNGRYMLVPIIDGFPPHGGGTVQILGIAAIYLAGWGEWDPTAETYDRMCPGGHTSVYVQFLDQVPFEPKDLVGESDNPLAPLRNILIK